MEQGSRWLDSEALLGEVRGSWRNSSSSALGGVSQLKLLMEVLIVLMCVGAVTGNILVMVIVMVNKTLHSVTSVLIINLAISDFLVGIGVMPFVAVSIINNGWVNCNALCVYVGYTSSVYCTASVLTLAAIALDRYFSIVDCLRYRSRCTSWRTGSAVLWIWLQAVLTSAPPLLGWGEVLFVGPVFSCVVNWAGSPGYTVLVWVLSFLLPAVVIMFCYVQIVRVARNHARRIHSLEEQLRNRDRNLDPPQPYDPARLVYCVSGRFVSEPRPHQNPEAGGGSRSQNPGSAQQGMVRLFLVIAAFFLCWTPYMTVALIQASEWVLSSPVTRVPPGLLTFSYWLLLFNSDLNPLLYALLSKRFQTALHTLHHTLRARLGGGARGGGGGAIRGGGGASNVTAGNGEVTVFTVSAVPKRLNQGLHPASVSSSLSSASTFCSSASCSSTSLSCNSTSSTSCSSASSSCSHWSKTDCLQVPSRLSSSVTTDRLSCSVTTDRLSSSVTTDRLSSSVTTDRLSSSVTTDRLSSTVTTDRLSSSVTTDRLSSSVTTDRQSSSVTTDRLSSSVTTDRLSSSLTTDRDRQSSSVTTDRLSSSLTTDRDRQSSSVTTDRLSSSVTTDRLSSSVTTDRLSSSVTTDRLSSSVTTDRLSTFFYGQITVQVEQEIS